MGSNGGHIRAIGYARVSTAEQGAEGVSLQTQRERISAFASSRGWELVSVFEDVASGGSLAKRRGVDEVLAEVRLGAVDVVIVAALDRLTRRLRDWAFLCDELQTLGVGIASLREGWDTTTPVGRAVAGVMATFAELERELGRERTRAALAHKREAGEVYGSTPYGFRRRDCHLLPDKRTLPVVREIFWLREGGMSLRQICAHLEERKIPAPRGGKEWPVETVRLILRNAPLYGRALNGLLSHPSGGQFRGMPPEEIRQRVLHDEGKISPVEGGAEA